MENITSFDELTNYVAQSSNVTQAEAAGAMGAMFGAFAGMAVAMIFVALVIYVLLVIAQWRIFKKAGEKGWKAIIPIYNVYIYLKIIGISFWKWLGIMVLTSVLASLLSNTQIQWLGVIAEIAASLFYAILIARNGAKAFGKGTGFAVGLFFLPNIFQLILGFGASEYQGVPTKEA